MEENKKNFIHTITHTITHTVKRLATWLHNGPVIVCDRPFKRDIHLNSSAAIRIYLAMLDRPLQHTAGIDLNTTNDWFSTYQDIDLDRPIHSDVTQTNDTGGGTPDEELE